MGVNPQNRGILPPKLDGEHKEKKTYEQMDGNHPFLIGIFQLFSPSIWGPVFVPLFLGGNTHMEVSISKTPDPKGKSKKTFHQKVAKNQGTTGCTPFTYV